MGERDPERLPPTFAIAARQLRSQPGFTIVSVLTLALGIGASTAIFSASESDSVEPLPYPHPGRILMIWSTFQGARSEMAFGTYRELAERSHSFDAMAIFEPWQPAMTGGMQPERLEGQSVSASFFRVIGVAPVLWVGIFCLRGRRSSAPKVVILSDKLWRRLFHGDPAILGASDQARRRQLHRRWRHGRSNFENVLSPSAEIWTPTQYDTRKITSNFNTWEWGNHLRMVGASQAGNQPDPGASTNSLRSRVLHGQSFPGRVGPRFNMG